MRVLLLPPLISPLLLPLLLILLLCRNLLDTLEDPGEELVLEYHAAMPTGTADGGDEQATALPGPAADLAAAGAGQTAVVC